MYDCGILATRLLNKLRCTLILQVSGLIGNIFAFFMFNGQVVASRPLAKVLLTLTVMSQEYISTSVRTTVGIVLLVITLSGVAVMALLRYIKNIVMLMMMTPIFM